MEDHRAETESSFCGKHALIVGGSGGIGAAIAKRLAVSGIASLTIHGGHQSDRFDALIAELTQAAAQLSPATQASHCQAPHSPMPRIQPLIQHFSATDFASLASSPIASAARSCDILCVCYGPFLQRPLATMTAADWQQLALLDYALPGFLVSTALPSMQAQRWGRIVLFGGTGTESRREFMTNAAYAGAKTAIGTLVQSTAACYAHDGITCNALLPGFTATEYTGTAAAGTASGYELAQKMPGGTLIAPDSVAKTVLFLLQNPDINGALIRHDRGWSPFK